MSRLTPILILLLGCLVFSGVASAVGEGKNHNFRAHLSGAEQVVPIDTRGQGQAVFQLSEDGLALHYKLIVANIEDVFMAHIHFAPAGENGAVVAWLYPAAPPPVPIPGRSDGVLAAGVITAANLVGPLEGQTMADLIEAISMGQTYVNVHTAEYPDGEIRGQIF
jgi:hypothetical protein